MKKALLLVVNYNSFNNTINYIESLYDLENSDNLDLIIIDNNSDKVVQNKLKTFISKSILKSIRLIILDNNYGYFGAIKNVLDSKIDDVNIYNYIIVSNNDIIIKDKFFLNKLFNKNKDSLLIAPQILYPDNFINQNPFRLSKITIKENIYWKIYFLNYYIAKILLGMKLIYDHF